MDFLLDAITSLFSSPSRGRQRTPQEENARAVAIYGLPTLAMCGVVAGARGVMALGALPLLALGAFVAVGPRVGLGAERSLRLGIKSACVCFAVNGLMLLLSNPLF